MSLLIEMEREIQSRRRRHAAQRRAGGKPAQAPAPAAAPTPGLARGMDGGVGAAVAIASLGVNVIKSIGENKGDITFSLQQLEGTFHPWAGTYWTTDAEKRRYGQPPWTTKHVASDSWFENKLGDRISASVDVAFQHNGYYVGSVAVLPVNTNDALGWALRVDGQLIRDNNAYTLNGKGPAARVDVVLTYTFSNPITNDRVYRERWSLYGDGSTAVEGKWLQ